MNRASQLPLSLATTVLLMGACMGEIQPAEEQPDAKIVFEASYSKQGRFIVSEDEAGRLGMSVTGSSSADEPGQVLGKIGRSLVATYRALLPDAEVPAVLERLDVRFQAQHPAGAAGAHQRPAPSLGTLASPAIAGTARANAAGFNSQFCRFRDEGTFYTVPQHCDYGASLSSLCVINDWNQPDPNIFPVNYVKNDSDNLGVWGYLRGLGLGTWVGPGQWAMGLPARRAGAVCFDIYVRNANDEWEQGAGPSGLTYAWGQLED
jgi:hypothetical protein